ncbi:M50 family metallopeptidase [Candidatus Woesearchaeota archaeon]|nr:M50 family metallopeptidase [Candidatus Woesearchaeota archaeon]
MGEFAYRIKRFFKFTPREMFELAITIIVVGFIFAYNDKQEVFSTTYWIYNLLKMILIVAIAVITHEIGHKVAALYIGMRTEYQMWPTGLLIGILFTFITNGKWYVVLPGGMLLHHLSIQRIGHFRYGLNYFTQGILAAMGPLTNLLFATFFKTLSLFGIFPEFFDTMTFINLYYAVFTMLPLPRLDGLHLFFGNRLTYVFVFGSLFGYIVLYSIGVYSLIFALLIGALFWLVFYLYIETKTVPLP